MAGKTLNEIHPFIAEILEGKHDEILRHVSRACDIRGKRAAAQSGLRPRSRIRVVSDQSDLYERTGIVERVNPKTVSVKLDPLHDHDFRTGWRLPHDWLAVINPGEEGFSLKVPAEVEA